MPTPTEATFWNDLAPRYAAQPVKDPDAFARKIAITQGKMKPADTILEVGCGTGSLALRLADHAARIHGIDISSEMIRIAEGKVAREGVTNLSFEVGPFDESFDTFAPGTVDGILAYSILHLLDDRQAALKRIYGLLKPGGFFVASTVCLGNTWVPYKPMLAVMRWLGKAPKRVDVLATQTLVGDIQAAGFVDVECPDVGADPIVCFTVARKPDSIIDPN